MNQKRPPHEHRAAHDRAFRPESRIVGHRAIVAQDEVIVRTELDRRRHPVRIARRAGQRACVVNIPINPQIGDLERATTHTQRERALAREPRGNRIVEIIRVKEQPTIDRDLNSPIDDGRFERDVFLQATRKPLSLKRVPAVVQNSFLVVAQQINGSSPANRNPHDKLIGTRPNRHGNRVDGIADA